MLISLGEPWSREKVVGEAGTVAAQHGAIAGADFILHDATEDGMEVEHLGEVVSGPWTEEGQAGIDHPASVTRCAGVLRIVEGGCVQPDAVEGTAEAVLFRGCKEPAGRAVGASPFRNWVDGRPCVGHSPNDKYAGQKSDGKWGTRPRDVGRLAGIVCHERDGVREGAELCFGGSKENLKALGRKNGMQPSTGSCKAQNFRYRGTGLKYMENKLGCQI